MEQDGHRNLLFVAGGRHMWLCPPSETAASNIFVGAVETNIVQQHLQSSSHVCPSRVNNQMSCVAGLSPPR